MVRRINRRGPYRYAQRRDERSPAWKYLVLGVLTAAAVAVALAAMVHG
ncbi:hypothetical protein [Arthrobacter sp.]|jgi:hypothetical protein|nr:hypothetical protein [Arthrobacter sp.]